MSALPTQNSVQNNCTSRIKPTLLRDVKTEALLVFARTALERYFNGLDKNSVEGLMKEHEEIAYLFETLHGLLQELQKYVVNVDYLIHLTQAAKNSQRAKLLSVKEEPLIAYYDVMAQTVRSHYKDQPAYLPELLVVCVLEEWILGEEKSTHLYPFLDTIDFLELIAIFEKNRKFFEKGESCKVSEALALSSDVVHKLKSFKYKVNKTRISKTRTKK